jgi:hypothetical protein
MCAPEIGATNMFCGLTAARSRKPWATAPESQTPSAWPRPPDARGARANAFPSTAPLTPGPVDRLTSGASAPRLGRFDGHIFVVAEYNHSITGVLKNALDQAYKEWNRKPFTAIGYGSVGGGRAIEHLRAIAVELQMVSTCAAVHIGGSDFRTVFPMGGNKPIEEIEGGLLPSANAALDQLSWWAKATMAAKAVEA